MRIQAVNGFWAIHTQDKEEVGILFHVEDEKGKLFTSRIIVAQEHVVILPHRVLFRYHDSDTLISFQRSQFKGYCLGALGESRDLDAPEVERITKIFGTGFRPARALTDKLVGGFKFHSPASDSPTFYKTAKH